MDFKPAGDSLEVSVTEEMDQAQREGAVGATVVHLLFTDLLLLNCINT